MGPTPRMLALEPRYLFDAAALVTGMEVAETAADNYRWCLRDCDDDS